MRCDEGESYMHAMTQLCVSVWYLIVCSCNSMFD